MDDLGFLASGNSIQEVVTMSHGKTGEAVLKWGLSNAVTYDIKTEAILFSKARSKRVKKEIAAIRLVFGEQGAKFNDKATRWLGVLYGLTADSYFSLR